MKTYALTLLFISIGWIAYAQDNDVTEIKTLKNELEIDASAFFNILNSNFSREGPYILTYHRHFNNKSIRIGVGGSLDLNTTVDSFTYRGENIYLIARAGLQWHNNIVSRWEVYYGFDITFAKLDRSSKSLTFQNEMVYYRDFSNSLGIGPNLGVKFRINHKISLATEASIQLRYSARTDYRDYATSNQYDRDIKSSALASLYNYPRSISFLFFF